MKTQPWVVAAIAVVVCLAAGPALAQADARRLEVGGHFSTLQIGDAGNTNAGLGGRVSYDSCPGWRSKASSIFSRTIVSTSTRASRP